MVASLPLHPVPELDQAPTLPYSIAHREPTAPLSHGPESLLQSHFFVFSPSATSRRIAWPRVRLPPCSLIQASIALTSGECQRSPI
jgi:hypothetical protein